MSKSLYRQTRYARFWYRPVSVLLFSPFTVLLIAYLASIELPGVFTHWTTLSLLTIIYAGYLWSNYKRVIACCIVRVAYAFGTAKFQARIESEFTQSRQEQVN